MGYGQADKGRGRGAEKTRQSSSNDRSSRLENSRMENRFSRLKKRLVRLNDRSSRPENRFIRSNDRSFRPENRFIWSNDRSSRSEKGLRFESSGERVRWFKHVQP